MLVPLEKILLGLGAAAVILLGILITSNVVARAVFASSVPDSVTLVRELMVAAILCPLRQRPQTALTLVWLLCPTGSGPNSGPGLLCLGRSWG